MSPVSRKRKKKNSSRRGGHDSSLARFCAEIVGSYREMVDESPFEVEVFTSELLGAWWWESVESGGGEDRTALDVVGHAGRQHRPEALALLRAFAALGTDPGLRDSAHRAAEALRTAGVPEPAWGNRIGAATPGRCWRLDDVFGEQTTLAVEFRRDSDRHALVALLDHDERDGEVWDIWFSTEPDELAREMAGQAGDTVRFGETEPAEAARLLREGFALAEDSLDLPDSEEFNRFRALALARLRGMPGEPPAPPEPPESPEPTDEELAALTSTFLASPEAGELSGTDAVRTAAEVIVEFGADEDGRPLRIGPGRLERLLHGGVEDYDPDDETRAAFPSVVTAWTRYAARRAELPSPAVAELVRIATECGNHLNEEDGAHGYLDTGEIDDIGDIEELVSVYLADIDPVDVGDPEELADVLARRMFAVPTLSARVDGEDLLDLDPTDPDDRHLLIVGEHPEYQAALADEFFSGEVDGVNPRLHVAAHEIVTNQLWDNDPPEAWAAAQRLLDSGAERTAVLHAIGDLAMEQVHRALTGAPDTAAYLTALGTLGTA